MTGDLHDLAASLVVSSLAARGGAPTQEEIRELAEWAMSHPEVVGTELDVDRIVKLVRSRVNVFAPGAAALEDNTGHEPWLPDRRGELDWLFWNRFRIWLQDRQQYPPDVVRRIDDVTDDILGRLEDPGRPGQWDRRGLVVGQVQSGKTSNYSGLICKAADAGYKLIVVLAGIHNSLRSQTQHRLDEAFLGMDSASNRPLGVGTLPFADRPYAVSLTSSTDKGDFKIATVNNATMRLGSDPLLVVVKKNATILSNFLSWVTHLNQVPGSDETRPVRDVPLLLIDDEADSASINTRDDDLDPTRINGLVRQIMEGFEKAAYVGYTATPFANLYISDTADNERFGRDLFPRSFIVALRPPSNYSGPSEVFGRSAVPELGMRALEGVPITRPVSDHEAWLPDRHKKSTIPGALPESLKDAIRAFALACAARRARGQVSHNSMLVHVTRFIDVQGLVTEQIVDYVSEIRNLTRYGGQDSGLMRQLEMMWRSDFGPTSREVVERRPEIVTDDDLEVTWNEVRENLSHAVDRIEVRKINGTATDALDYVNHEAGLSVIAVGGDKLSRGLTLEGLTVSYYLRASKMYDTLMQMGRWFGYRPGYLDLCRLYTTHELISWYRDIAAATEELWTDFEYMASVKETPQSYGLRVRHHPGGLLVTAATKMRNGEKRSLSYSNTVSESVVFFEDEEKRRTDLDVLDALLGKLGPAETSRTKHLADRPHVLWQQVGGQTVSEYLSRLNVHPDSRRARPQLLARYIAGAMRREELIEWTVALVSTQSGEPYPVGPLQIGITTRKRNSGESEGKYGIQRLLDPTHEALDLSDDEYEAALAQTRSLWQKNPGAGKDSPDVPSGAMARAQRPRERGLLLIYLLAPRGEEFDGLPYIGFGLSFPISEETTPIEYVVNNVYMQQELDFEDAT